MCIIDILTNYVKKKKALLPFFQVGMAAPHMSSGRNTWNSGNWVSQQKNSHSRNSATRSRKWDPQTPPCGVHRRASGEMWTWSSMYNTVFYGKRLVALTKWPGTPQDLRTLMDVIDSSKSSEGNSDSDSLHGLPFDVCLPDSLFSSHLSLVCIQTTARQSGPLRSIGRGQCKRQSGINIQFGESH